MIVSPEREVQQDREKGTLMAIYPSIFDIPPSPREPADPYTGDFVPEQNFGTPDAIVKVIARSPTTVTIDLNARVVSRR